MSANIKLACCASKESFTSTDSRNTVRHNYYTRYSARHSLNLPVSSVNLNTNKEQQHFEGLTKSIAKCEDQLSTVDVENVQLDDCYLLSDSQNDILLQKHQYNNMRSRCYAFDNPCLENNTKKWTKFFIIFASIGLLAIMMAYINDKYTQSFNSINKVSDELYTIKKQVEGMKGEVVTVAQKRDDTEKKLGKIEDILLDLKKTQRPGYDKVGPTGKLSATTNEPMRNVVKEILTEYDADKTGKIDFALESAGGTIVHIGKTQNFIGGADTLTLFGVPLCEGKNGPRAMIQPGMLPGQCWAFSGSTGTAIIRLLGNVFINGVSLEHIPKSISPSGDLLSAPKDFSVWGVHNVDQDEAQFLGRFVYDINGSSLQNFDIQASQKSYLYIKFKVHSNHGNSDFTCVYRFRVHGILDTHKNFHCDD